MSRRFTIGGKSVLFVCVVAALLVLNRPVATQSQSQAGDDVSGFTAPDEPQVFSTFVGGSLMAIRMRESDVPVLLAPAAVFTSLAGASIPWTVAAGDNDLIHVTFTAECQLRRNGAVSSPFDWVETRAIISAVPARAGYPKLMAPYDVGSPRALCGSEEYNSVVVHWADRPTAVAPATTYNVTVQVRVVDNAPASVPALTGWVDDYGIELRAYN